ncbi:hypothetical protein D3C81_1527750 [compost metagenome]
MVVLFLAFVGVDVGGLVDVFRDLVGPGAGGFGVGTRIGIAARIGVTQPGCSIQLQVDVGIDTGVDVGIDVRVGVRRGVGIGVGIRARLVHVVLVIDVCAHVLVVRRIGCRTHGECGNRHGEYCPFIRFHGALFRFSDGSGGWNVVHGVPCTEMLNLFSVALPDPAI